MATKVPEPASHAAHQASDKFNSLVDFRANGVAVVDWARLHGFSAALVYAVLRGERKCLRGQSFEIAKALGIK
jgi:gp16 family phage-associated protein